MFELEKNVLKSHLGEQLYKELKECKCFIAGGMITSIFSKKDIKDIDVYFRNRESAYDFLVNKFGKHHVVFKSNRAITMKVNSEKELQAIYFDYFNSASDIFNKFDFTVCMGAYDFSTEEFIFSDDYFTHLAQRKLVFNPDTAYPIVSAARVNKYIDKGYTISRAEYLKICLKISTLNLQSSDELLDQIGGMYGEDYEEYLKDENFSIDSAIDKLSYIHLHDITDNKSVERMFNYDEEEYELEFDEHDEWKNAIGICLGIIEKKVSN